MNEAIFSCMSSRRMYIEGIAKKSDVMIAVDMILKHMRAMSQYDCVIAAVCIVRTSLCFLRRTSSKFWQTTKPT